MSSNNEIGVESSSETVEAVAHVNKTARFTEDSGKDGELGEEKAEVAGGVVANNVERKEGGEEPGTNAEVVDEEDDDDDMDKCQTARMSIFVVAMIIILTSGLVFLLSNIYNFLGFRFERAGKSS
jgi:hypothetical protein